MQSIIVFGFIAGGKIHGRDRQMVFSTAVDPMEKFWSITNENIKCLNTGTPGTSMYAVSWVDVGRAQRKAPQFYQTSSNAIILHDSLPLVCIERVVSRKIMKSCIQEKVNRHDLLIQLPSKLIGKEFWIRLLMHQQAAVNWRAW